MKTKYFLGLIGFWLLLALPAGAAIDAIKRNYYTTNANPTIVTSGGGTNLANWKIWTDGALYFAQNREASSTISSNDISGLLQNLCGQSVTAGFSTRFEFGSGTDTRSSTSNRYYWFTNTVYVTNGVIFSGQGNAATIFAASPALTGPLIQVGADGNFLSGIVRFEHIRFHGDAGAALSVGLKFRNVAEPNVSHCEFNGFQLAGIQFNNTNYNHWSQVLNSWFVGGGLGSHCILFDAAPAAITCEAQVRNCLIEPHGGGGITVSNHFRNLSISGCRFSDSSGTSTHAIRVFAGNGFQFIGNNFYPFWPSSVPLIRFDDRASATNINADVSHNITSGLTTQNLIWIGTNVQGVSMVGNVNPGGNIVTNGSGGNATYVRADREKIHTDGDINASGGVVAATANFTTQNNGTLNVTNFNIVNGWNAANATNIPVRALWGSGGTNTANTNGTAGQALYSAGNGGAYWGAGGGQVSGNVFGDRATWNGSAWEDDSRWIHFEQEFLMSAATGWPLATFNGGAGGQLSAVDTTTNRIGVQALSAGTTATSYYGECVGGASIRTFTWGQGEEMITDLTCYVPTLSDDTENYCFQFGYSESQITNAPADGVFWQYSNNTNSGAWQVVSRNSAGSTNVYNIGTNVVANRWYDLRLKTATDGTSAAYLDGVLVQSGIAATSGQVIPLFRINKAAGTTDRTVRLDYYRWSVRRAISRYQ